MGLDGVELMMEVEDEFGITIPDSAASEMQTVGDLVSLCFDRIHASEVATCHSLPCFLVLRRLVREILGDDKFRIRPRDRVEACLGKSNRKTLWKRLPELLQTTPRQLRRPSWVRKALVAAVLVFPIVAISLLPWSVEFFVLVWIVTFAFGICLHLATITFRSQTPEGYHTFGEIAKRMVGLSVATKPPAKTDYETVFSIVKRIVVEQLGVEDDEVTSDARFVEDLGVG